MTDLLVRLFVRNSDNVNDPKVRESYGTLVGVVGIAGNLLLSVFKILIGSLTASISIVADGLNNLSDMGSSVITMLGFRMAGKPADADHPFGHGRIEYISALIVSMFILLVGFELLKSSAGALINGDASPVYTKWALIILAISIIAKLLLFVFNKKISKKIDSESVAATAQDCVNDVLATSVILLSVLLQMFIKIPFNLDAVMGIGVALFIIFSGLKSAKSTVEELLGTPASKELVEEIANTVMSFDDFKGYHDLIVHNYGPGRCFASLHVEVPSDVNVVECHEKIDLCEKLVNEKCGIELVIHMDPIDVNDENVVNARKAVAAAVKKIDERITIHDFRMTPKCDERTNLIFDVVVPSGFKMKDAELGELIAEKAREIDKTYCAVITFDRDFTGK